MQGLHKHGRWILLPLLLGLSSCASLEEGFKDFKFPEFKASSFGFNSYATAKRDFERGRIMEARARVMAMDKSRDDYPQAKALLEKQIEPARLRLLRHYSAKASAAERSGDWSSAMDLYDQAASFSIEPKALQQNRDRMEMKMRQARLDSLIERRRKLDAAWLAAADNLESPKGVDPKDDVVGRERDRFQSAMEDRADDAYDEAARYLRKGIPEIAYLEIESSLRLQPDSDRARNLMEEIKAAMPKGLEIPSERRATHVSKPVVSRKPLPKSVTRQQIEAFVKKGDLLAAKRYALVYRREGGANAAALLKQIEAQIEAKAADHYNRGRLEFRREHLNTAVKEWSKAVELMPDNPEYVEQLRRGQQLQDRLKLLKDGGQQEAPASSPK